MGKWMSQVLDKKETFSVANVELSEPLYAFQDTVYTPSDSHPNIDRVIVRKWSHDHDKLEGEMKYTQVLVRLNRNTSSAFEKIWSGGQGANIQDVNAQQVSYSSANPGNGFISFIEKVNKTVSKLNGNAPTLPQDVVHNISQCL